MTKEKITRINTDLGALLARANPIRTPFESFWIPNSKAYVTPDDDEFRVALSRLKPGDVVVAAEDRRGIVGLGVVLRTCDFNDEPVPILYPDERTWKLDVAWDGSVQVPHEVVQQINREKKEGTRDLGTSFVGTINGLSESLYPFVHDAARRAYASTSANDRDEVDPNPDKNRITTALARIGHEEFKRALKPRKCRVTGTDSERLLIASHIVAWEDCMGRQHLNPNNGLLLAPHIDYLFDRHLISFGSDGSLLVSPLLSSDDIANWSLNPIPAQMLSAEQEFFMVQHRDKCLKKAEKEKIKSPKLMPWAS